MNFLIGDTIFIVNSHIYLDDMVLNKKAAKVISAAVIVVSIKGSNCAVFFLLQPAEKRGTFIK